MTAQPPRSTRARPTPPGGLGADAGLVSGEAVELEFRVARLGSRMLALLIDIMAQVVLALVLLVLAMMVVDLAFGSEPPDQALLTGLHTVGAILILVGYPVLWETLNHGRTPGKLAVGLRVVRDDGGRLGLRPALTRSLVNVAAEWPGLMLPMLTWVASVTVMLTDPRGRRLGDLAAGTIVIHDRSPVASRHVPIPAPVPVLAAWTRTLDLTRLDDSLALAVRQLLGRATTLTESARRRLSRSLWAEVAAVTSPPPPIGLPEWAYLSAVLAERHVRAGERLARTRSVSATLWPELAPAAEDATPPAPVRPAVPAVPTANPVRPAVPGANPVRPAVAATSPDGAGR